MNWSYLGTALPQGPEIIDFYHACEHLKRAFDAAYGENSSRSKASTGAPRGIGNVVGRQHEGRTGLQCK